MGQNLVVLPLKEGHSDLGFVPFAQLWNPFFFFSGIFDGIIFSISSNNHWADEVNTILCMVIGKDFKFSPDTSFNCLAYIVYK